MRNITIGIDPGLHGAISFLYDDGEYHVHDLPVIEDKSLKWIDGGALTSLILAHPGNRWAFVERVSAMPKQGVSSSFQFGVGFGAVLGALQGLQVPLQLVTSVKWKREISLTNCKKQSLGRARMLFPMAELHLAKHADRAEALLIAHWARTHVKRVLPVQEAA